MTEESWRFSAEEVAASPSVRGGWPTASELHYRSLAVRRACALKDLLACPQIVVSCTAVYIHRFFMRETMQEYDHAILASAAFFLASKVEENPRRLRDIVGVTNDLNAGRNAVQGANGRLSYDETTEEFLSMRKKILFYEGVLLTSLAFDLTITHPYAAMLRATSLAWRGKEELRAEIARRAWLFINDSLITTVCLTHSPGAIASASISLACLQLETPLPTDPSLPDETAHLTNPEEGADSKPGVYWLTDLKVTSQELEETVALLLAPYRDAKDDYVRIEAAALSAPPPISPKPIVAQPIQEVPLETTIPEIDSQGSTLVSV